MILFSAGSELPEDSADRLPARPQSPRRSFAAYCLAIAMVPVLAIAASVILARSTWYVRHQKNSYLAISDYPFTLKNVNCDVLIYGDSSALTGISPVKIEELTSLRACNIAQPNTALSVVKTFPLDSYLANNAPPKFLIFQFTAPDFSPYESDTTLYEEGALQLLRHKLDFSSLKVFARHPLEAIGFSQFILRTALIEKDSTGATYDRSWKMVQANHGLFTVARPPLESCAGTMEKRLPDPAWIARLRNKYSNENTHVLVYVAPFPACDDSFDFYSGKLIGLAGNPLERYDIHLFNEKNHFTMDGANRNSTRMAADLNRLLRQK